MKFTDIDLPQNILKSLRKMGFEEMTPVQEKTYEVISERRDLCALAETGSGKTAACAIPLIEMVDPSENTIQGLVIVPTRELCLQYVDEITSIADKTPVIPFAIFGGFDKTIQAAKIRDGVHILVATPGRLIDLVYDGTVDLQWVKCAILDEADELLKVGFLEDLETIFSCMVHKHQILLFSATMSDDIKKLTRDCLHDPVYVDLIAKRSAPESLEHYFQYLHPKDKMNALMQYLETEDIRQAIIFCNARHRVDKLFRLLKKKTDKVEFIHAGLVQGKRTSIFNRFKRGKIKILLATDIAGRGLDFSKVTHIINWDFPGAGQQYTHRTGRTGRMGRAGKAMTFITKHDLPGLKSVLKAKKITPHWIGKDPFTKPASQGDTRHTKKRTTTPPFSGRKRSGNKRRSR